MNNLGERTGLIPRSKETAPLEPTKLTEFERLMLSYHFPVQPGFAYFDGYAHALVIIHPDENPLELARRWLELSAASGPTPHVLDLGVRFVLELRSGIGAPFGLSETRGCLSWLHGFSDALLLEARDDLQRLALEVSQANEGHGRIFLELMLACSSGDGAGYGVSLERVAEVRHSLPALFGGVMLEHRRQVQALENFARRWLRLGLMQGWLESIETDTLETETHEP
jgi:hypothetical protein